MRQIKRFFTIVLSLCLLTTFVYTTNISTQSFYDLAACDYNRQGGDSGGIVISTRTGANWIAGVHKGTGGGYSTFTKAINITPGLNLTFKDGSDW